MPPRAQIVGRSKRAASAKAAAEKPPAPEPLIITDAHLDARIAEVSGEVFDAPYEAYLLRMKGVPWPEVAKQTGYGSGNSVAMAVSVYLQKAALAQSAQHLQEALQLQIDRYERVLHEWWELGTTGHDEKAAMIVLRALERLDRVQRITEGDTIVTKETLVISADPDEYVRQLQEAWETQKPR